MRAWLIIGMFAMAVLLQPVQNVIAHGTPIGLSTDGTSLIVSGGLADPDGFASQIFHEDDADGEVIDPGGPLPNVGNVFYWEIPGLNMSGLNTESSLSMEVLARAPRCADPQEEAIDRVLWYWNSAEGVAPAQSDMYLLGTGLRYETLAHDEEAAPPPFLLVDPVGGTAAQGGQQGFHNHNLLTYALDANSPPAVGAYGIFARMTSNQYEPSDPFLIVLNFGVDYEQMTEAALAINAAAGDPLAGDFNYDCVVDAADYVTWRKTIGTAPEYETWRTNFGNSTGEMNSSHGSRHGTASQSKTTVPEPPMLCGVAATLVGLLTLARPCRQRAVAG